MRWCKFCGTKVEWLKTKSGYEIIKVDGSKHNCKKDDAYIKERERKLKIERLKDNSYIL